jgi:NADH-quinone oxidoreductase subunit F
MRSERRIILQNAGLINPESIDDYISAGGYQSAKKALERGAAENVEEIVTSGLRGRGGAGYPTGMKMRAVLRAGAGTVKRYLICNADEGEPGTFKDRYIIENDPHLLIEGIIIASWSVGATKAYIYIRGEYFRSIFLLEQAIYQAKEKGWLGENLYGTGFSLDIEIRKGAGSYLCGEELTLLESLEGRRGYPRIKPPFPAEKGLFGSPTLVNNVETLANLPVIISKGAEWFSSIGLKNSPGTKLFTISGDVVNGGCYETEMGVTLRDLIFGLAGGIPANKKFSAALIGGAAGTFIDESVLDTPVGFESLKEVGATLGSGAIIVLDETRSIKEMTGSLMKFFRHESCGKCVPCRIGTYRLAEMTGEIVSGTYKADSGLDDMIMEADYMARTSLCPLGQSPILALRSLKRYFSNQF